MRCRGPGRNWPKEVALSCPTTRANRRPTVGDMTRRSPYPHLPNSIGDAGFLVVPALYFTQTVGLSAARVGLALTLAWGVGAVAGVALGHVADRLGPRTTAVVLAAATATSVGILLFT